MGTVQNEKKWGYLVNQQDVINQLLFMKIEKVEESVLNLANEQEKKKQKQVFLEEGGQNGRFSLENERRKLGTREDKENKVQEKNDWQESQKIVERAVEILADWEEAEDIRIQVQYAAILVGKIDRLKKTGTVGTDDVRRKICTLLRNVIRLNAAERRFSQEQIQILKTGFSMIAGEKVQKQDLLQLNRTMLKEGLQTMPAWE